MSATSILDGFEERNRERIYRLAAEIIEIVTEPLKARIAELEAAAARAASPPVAAGAVEGGGIQRDYADYDVALPPISWRALSTYKPQGVPPECLLLCENKGRRQIVSGHWASDTSGEEQPPFHGWFVWDGYGFRSPPGVLLAWSPLPASWRDPEAARAIHAALPTTGAGAGAPAEKGDDPLLSAINGSYWRLKHEDSEDDATLWALANASSEIMRLRALIPDAALKEIDELRAYNQLLIDSIAKDRSASTNRAGAGADAARRAGAEAMREAAAQVVQRWSQSALWQADKDHMAAAIRALSPPATTPMDGGGDAWTE